MRKCTICGKVISIPFWVCAECEEKWGLVDVDYKDWPEWVKALVSIDRREVYLREQLTVIYTDNLEELLRYNEDAKVL